MVAALALVVTGIAVGWRVVPSSETHTAIGRVSFQVSPSLSGDATAVIPVADWGFRADAFDAPFELRAELRSLDRAALTRAADGDLSVLRATEEELEAGARAAVLKAFAWGAAGALVALVLATLIWRRLRPRCALLATGAAIALVFGVGSLVAARQSFDARAFEQPTYFANGAELARILEVVGDDRAASGYGSTFGSILRSVTSVLAGAPSPVEPGRDVYLASDLHANALVVEPLSTAIADEPLVLAGDFGQRGGAAEARVLAPRVAALGSRVIATSGNHDTGALMEALAARGVTVLGDGSAGTPQAAEVDGLRVAGFPDPLEWSGPGDPESRPITFDDLDDPAGAFEDAASDLVAGFDSIQPPPDVAIVHQGGLAAALAEELFDRGDERDLTIFTGHSHRQRIDRYGEIVVVNGGSVGAGGLFGAGREAIGFAEVHFEPGRPRVRSVDLISIEPFSGAAQASRVVVDALCPDDQICSFEPPGTDGSILDRVSEDD